MEIKLKILIVYSVVKLFCYEKFKKPEFEFFKSGIFFRFNKKNGKVRLALNFSRLDFVVLIKGLK